jgi:pyruvate/2-oxoacid:ferredoxin oxidoreductase alpha subunit
MTSETKPPEKLTPEQEAAIQKAYKEDMAKLTKMQAGTKQEAHNVAQESLGVMMAMGWTWDAAMEEIKDKKTGEVVKRGVHLVIRPMNLHEWQTVQKERLRNQLMGK